MRQSYFFRWPRFSWPAAFPRTAPGEPEARKSSSTVTPKSASYAAKRPSLYLSLAFLAVGISAALSLLPEATDSERAALLAKGWREVAPPPCEHLHEGFLEVEAADEIRELYIGGEGALAPTDLPWPEPPLYCRSISHPSYIQEIL